MYGFLVPPREEHIVSGLFFIALYLDILWYWRLTTIYFLINGCVYHLMQKLGFISPILKKKNHIC
jgi:hypothetical protein